jgi:RNA polymerase sigma factor for flagellar operon FliA
MPVSRREARIVADNRLLAEYLPLVRTIAASIQRAQRRMPGLELDDLYQDGCLGLLDAVRRRDPERMETFKAFASARIRGRILDGLRTQYLEWRSARVRAARCGRCPHHQAGSDVVRCAADRCPHAMAEVSLEDLGLVTPLAVVVSAGVPDHFLIERLRQCLGKLSARDKNIIWAYYFDGRTLEDIGQMMLPTLSKARVSQLHAEILCRLRRELEKQRKAAA